jgi:hypothetical protein
MYCDIPAYRCWVKDYYTSALPYRQRGTAPVIPLLGNGSAVWDGTNMFTTAPSNPGAVTIDDTYNGLPNFYSLSTANGKENLRGALNDNVVQYGSSGIDISDVRLAVQTQRYLERNMRTGYRYAEQLEGRWGVHNQDARLQKPEYIGGTVGSVIHSEVLQTSSTDATSPQANMSGHGMAIESDGQIGRYHAKEYGVIMGIMSIVPESVYMQGKDRSLGRFNELDFYSPEFAHLSEQEISTGELYFVNGAGDDVRFGYQGAWDEYRTRQNKICGNLATDALEAWHLARKFGDTPTLNEDFLTMKNFSENRRDAWAVSEVQNQSQGQYLVEMYNLVKALRPLPYIAEPGMIDHF